MEALTAMPPRFAAGTTVEYTRKNSDFPASQGWSLTVYLAGPGTASSAASASGDTFTVMLAASATEGLAAGTYQWTERYEKAGKRYDVSGTVVVTPNLALAAPGDLQSYAEKVVEALEAGLVGKLTKDQEQLEILGRSIRKIPATEYAGLLLQWRAIRDAEQNPGRFGPDVRFTFTGVENET